jgi:two-component system, NtrC family, response regulator AtoC
VHHVLLRFECRYAAAMEHLTPHGCILLADDDDDLRAMIRFHLEQEGREVEEVDSGLNLLDQLISGVKFDLVVSDVRMPWMSGLQVATAIRRKGFDVPFIIMSAFGSDELSQNVLSLGNAVFLQKPFELETFSQAVSQAIGC